MGRRKLEMKKIADKQSRQVTFTKRRGGLIKKASEISVLCDADVALLVFSTRGKLFQFCSSPSITQVIQRYNRHYETEGMDSTTGLGAESRFARYLTSSELLEIIERQLEEPHVDRLSAHDLALIESQIDAAVFQIRSRKTQLMLDSITALHEKEKMLQEENNRLVDELDVMVTDQNNTGKVLAADFSPVNHHMDSHSPRLTLDLL